MKHGLFLALVACTLVLSAAGCQSRSTRHRDTGAWGETNTIDGYAKVHGITRQEAAKRMREQMVPPPAFDSHQPSAETAAATPETVNK
jgi:hypothetical protein